MIDVALDTSVALPYLLKTHPSHTAVRRHVGDRRPLLTSHSLAETYSVITRLSGDAWLAAADAVAAIESNFGRTAVPSPDAAGGLPRMLAPLHITGGAVYDALVALAARDADLSLVTRDARATVTYRALQAPFELVPDGPDQPLPAKN